MPKTTEIAADRAHDTTKTVLPAEVARGVYTENSPSAQALKLMHVLIATAGGRMADDVRHDIRLSDIRKIDGMRNHDRASLRALFIELSAAVLVYDDTEAQCETIGGMLDRAKLDYRHEASGDLLVSWWFGGAFREMAAESCHWAIMDRQTVFALSSKYSILLFQHIASLTGLAHVHSKSFTIAELRAVLGIPDAKMGRWNDMNRFALKPAIAEINQLSRLTLTATPQKVGRTVVGVEITWEPKEPPRTREVRQELDRPKVGRAARRAGTAETPAETPAFPASGGISYSCWGKIARTALPRPLRDLEAVAADFRTFCEQRSIPLDAPQIEKTFRTFCERQKPAV